MGPIIIRCERNPFATDWRMAPLGDEATVGYRRSSPGERTSWADAHSRDMLARWRPITSTR